MAGPAGASAGLGWGDMLTEWVKGLLAPRATPTSAPNPLFQWHPGKAAVMPSAPSTPAAAPAKRDYSDLLKTWMWITQQPAVQPLKAASTPAGAPASGGLSLPMLLKGLSARTPIDTAGMGYHMEDMGYGNVPALEPEKSWEDLLKERMDALARALGEDSGDSDAYNYAALAQQKALAEAQMAQDWAIMQAQLEQRKREMAAQIGQAMVAQQSQNWSRGLGFELPKGTLYAPGFEPGGPLAQMAQRRGLNYTPTQIPVSNPLSKSDMEAWLNDALAQFV